MTNTADGPVRTSSGSVVHLGSTDGLNCGSDRYRNYRTRFVTLPAGTAITCRKCLGDAPIPVATPAPASTATTCPEGHRIPASNNGECLICL